jgi:hypothetical protein
MSWNPGLTKIRDLLAYLYPTVQGSQMVVDEAGLPTGRIAFNPASTSNWHNILQEAHRRGKVQAIVDIARTEYPEQSAELTEAEGEYLRWLGESQSSPAGPAAAAETPAEPSKYNIQIGEATGIAIGDGATVVQDIGNAGQSRTDRIPSPTRAPAASGPDPAAVRDLLLAAFTADDLRRLFLYTANPDLRPLTNRFSSRDGLAEMAETVITYCQKRNLLADLLREVRQANPRQYARFEPLLQVPSSQATATTRFDSEEQRVLLEQELAQHQRNLVRLRAKKAVYAAGEEPLSLLNQIDAEMREIQRVETEIARLA